MYSLRATVNVAVNENRNFYFENTRPRYFHTKTATMVIIALAVGTQQLRRS